MTKEELEKDHPELVAELRSEGVAAELKRTKLHLSFGKKAGLNSGGMARALKAVEAGEPLTESLMAEYFDCRDRQRMSDAYQQDCDAAGAVVDGASSHSSSQLSGAEALANEVERQRSSGPGRSIL